MLSPTQVLIRVGTKITTQSFLYIFPFYKLVKTAYLSIPSVSLYRELYKTGIISMNLDFDVTNACYVKI